MTGGDVTVSQYNFSGIGAMVAARRERSFASGIRFQVLHAYADSSVTTASRSQTVVDPRFYLRQAGVAPRGRVPGHPGRIPNRTGRAAAKNYGYDLVSMMKAYF